MPSGRVGPSGSAVSSQEVSGAIIIGKVKYYPEKTDPFRFMDDFSENI